MSEGNGNGHHIFSANFTKKALLEFAVLIVMLLIIGLLMQYKMNALLNSAVEQAIARQTADFSLLAEERFNREMAELTYAAKYLETHPHEIEDVLTSFEAQNREGVTSGLLDIEGRQVIGSGIEEKAFARLRQAFGGNPIIDYADSQGLIFAVPVYRGDNVRYTLYRLYRPELLTDAFGLEEYDADSRILIWDQNGELIVPYVGYGEKDQQFFEDPDVEAGYAAVREKLSRNKSAAVYSEGAQGKFFLFGADLPQTNCAMMGYVPWEAVAGSISRIYILVSSVVILLLLLFAIASIYLFMVQERAAESDALKNAKKIADRANEAKSNFLSQMSHEIRTPINAVLGLNEMIIRESKESEIQVYAQKISSAGHALLALINDVLDFSKIESGHLELTETNYDTSELFRDVVNLTEARAEKKGLELALHVDENIPRELWGDVVRIRQIIVNLMTNAIKYTPKGRVDFFAQCTPKGPQGIMLEVKVKDTGIGIREEDKDLLFKDFERLDAVRNRSVEGTGLGLAITYRLVKLMQGDISVDSEYGKGSTFSFQIPQQVTSFEPIGEFFTEDKPSENLSARSTNHSTKFTAPDARVLIVDDNEINLFVAERLLKETKMSIVTCFTGGECIERMAREHFDIVLLDHMMPEMDGMETMEIIKSMAPCKDTPVIALTANAVVGAREMFLSAGFSDYLTKPINSAILEETLLKFLPKSKILPTSVSRAEATKEEAPPSAENPSGSGRIDQKLGIKYNGGMEDLYFKVLGIFAKSHDSKKAKVEEALAAGDFKIYTTFVHALKSTALTVGCPELSEKARALEMAGKSCMSQTASPTEKEKSIAFIQANHGNLMELCDEVAEEAGKISQQKNNRRDFP